MNRFITVATLSLMVAFNVGCASASGSDYYEAIRKTAEAQALASEAKYRALAQVAASGDGQAASAAVMAIALSQDKTVTPQYVESTALKWAQVLTPTVGTLGLGLIQAGVSKNASDNASKVQMASMASNEAIQLGQQGMVGDLVGDLSTGWSTSAAAGGAATAEIAIAGFTALNTAGGQTVSLGVAGLDATENVATVGMNNITQLGQDGLTTASTIANFGMTGMQTLGVAGMEGIADVSNTGMTNLTTLGVTGMALVDSQGNNYADIITDMQSSIDSAIGELATPITCSPDANGAMVCQ